MLDPSTSFVLDRTIFPLSLTAPSPKLLSPNHFNSCSFNLKHLCSTPPCHPSLSSSLPKLRKISVSSKQNQEQSSELRIQDQEDENGVIREKSSAKDSITGGYLLFLMSRLLPCAISSLVITLGKIDFRRNLSKWNYTSKQWKVMNGPIVSIAKELGFEGDAFLEGLVVSIFIAGAFVGSVCAGSVVDKLGCRRTFQVDTIPLIIGAIISAQAHSLQEILLGRFLVGLGIGVNNVLVPIYISEVAPTKYRGSLGTVSQIGTCLGIIASLILGISSESDPHWWRIMLYTASVPGFILAVGMQFAVDSPRWLCKSGRLDEAADVVKNLWGVAQVETAVEEFQSVIRSDGADLDSSWLELLEEPHSKVAFIGGTLFLLQQFAGINAVLYFSSLTFADAGITSSALASLYVGIMYFAGALGASYLIDKQGRQTLLIGSYLGMAVAMFLVASVVSLQLEKEVGVNLTILGTILYIISFSVGAGPVTGLIIPELSSSRTRGKVMGFSLSVHWVCNFLVGLYFLEVVEKFGVAPVYAGFGGVSLLTAAFAYYFTVETKGRSLEEIEMSLNSSLQSRSRQ